MPKRVPREMALDDVDERRKQFAHERSVARVPLVAIDRVKEPQRGVRGVVQALTLAFGKHVGNEPVADVEGKCPEDVARLGVAAGEQASALRG